MDDKKIYSGQELILNGSSLFYLKKLLRHLAKSFGLFFIWVILMYRLYWFAIFVIWYLSAFLEGLIFLTLHLPFIIYLVSSLKKILGERQPRSLSLNERGIMSSEYGFIPWGEVVKISELPSFFGDNDRLIVEVKSPNIYIDRQRDKPKVLKMWQHLSNYNTPIVFLIQNQGVSLESLKNLMQDKLKEYHSSLMNTQ